MRPLLPRQALDLVAGGPEAAGPLAGRPLVAVLVGDDDASRRCAGALHGTACVTVAVDREARLPDLPDGFDVFLTAHPDPPAPWVGGQVDELLNRVESGAETSPEAAVAVVQLLRLGASLDLRSALVAESLAYGMLQSGPSFRRWLAARPEPSPREEAGSPVLAERRGDVLRITLNRPAVHNAYSSAMRDALVEALALAVQDDSVARVELDGAGPSFCSGGDLAEFGTTPDPVTGHFVRCARSPAWWLIGCADRTTATVHGRCLGAGVELPAFAGRVEAHPDTTFRLPEVAMGLIPGAGGTASLPRRVGRHRTAFLAVSGSEIGAGDALRWGLVDHIGPDRDPGRSPS